MYLKLNDTRIAPRAKLLMAIASAALVASCTKTDSSKEEAKIAETDQSAEVATKAFTEFVASSDPITQRCKSTNSQVVDTFTVTIRRVDTVNLEGSEVDHNGQPHTLSGPMQTGHDTHADIDASQALRNEKSVVKIIVKLADPGVTFAEGKSIVIDKDDKNKMFCVSGSLGQPDDKTREFFVEHRKKTSADDNIGNYYLILKTGEKFIEKKIDPNVKNTG